MTSQAKLGVSYIQLNNGLINCTHVGCFSHLPQSVNHYLILNVTVGCVLELQLWFRQVLVTYSQVESSIWNSSCGFELLVAIKAILHHCNYYLDYFFWLMKAFTAASLLHCFILQWLSKLWDILCELCVCLQIYMLKFTWYQSLDGQGTSPPQISYWIIFLFCRYNFEMISSLMRQGLCQVSIGLSKECFSKINWLNKSMEILEHPTP